MVEVALEVGPVEVILSVAVVFYSQRGSSRVVHSVAEQEVVFNKYVVSDSVGRQQSKSELILSDKSSVVKSHVLPIVSSQIYPQTVVRVACL